MNALFVKTIKSTWTLLIIPFLSIGFIYLYPCDNPLIYNLFNYTSLFCIILLISFELWLYFSVKISQTNRFLLLFLLQINTFLFHVFFIVYNLLLLILLGLDIFYIGNIFHISLDIILFFSLIFALLLGWKFLSILFQYSQYKFPVNGFLVTSQDQPYIWSFLHEIVKELKTQPPQNIILGLGCDYFVSQTEGRCFNGKFQGKTLFISISLFDKLTKDELKAILAHELSHLKHLDTHYLLKFSKNLNTLKTLLKFLISQNIKITYPHIILLKQYIEIVSIIDAHFSRDAERIADKVACRITSSEIFSLALCKICYYSYYWGIVEKQYKKLISQGKRIVNTNIFFNQFISEHLNNIANIVYVLNQDTVTHIFDSHPSLKDRMQNIGSEYNFEKIFTTPALRDNACSLISEKELLEEDLSFAEQYILYKEETL